MCLIVSVPLLFSLWLGLEVNIPSVLLEKCILELISVLREKAHTPTE